MLLEVKGTSGGAKTRPKTKWAFPRANWLAFREECEVAFAEADPEHSTVQDRAARFTAVIQRASRKHIPRGARKDPKPWALDPRLQEAEGKRREALRQLRAGVPGSKERWVEAKQHAARLEREVSQAHFREFVEKELNKPASLGRTTRLLKRWAGEDDHRPGEAMETEDGRLLATDREKADAFNRTYAQVARQVRLPVLDREVERKLGARHTTTAKTVGRSDVHRRGAATPTAPM